MLGDDPLNIEELEPPMSIDLRQGTVPVEVFRKTAARKEKLLADLRVFKDERGVIAGWEAPAFKAGYTFPVGVVVKDELDARAWFEARLADGSFDWLLVPTEKNAGAKDKSKTSSRKRRLVNAAKYRTDRDIERAIESKRAEITEMEERRAKALEQGEPDKLAGVITKSKAYLEELQVLRTGVRGKF